MLKLWNDTLENLRRNASPGVRYVLAAVGILMLFRGAGYVLYVLMLAETVPAAASLVRMGLMLYLAAAMSAAQAVFFAALGAALARPIWKYGGYRDALKRFYVLWLIINLALVTLIDIRAHLLSIGENEVAGMLEIFLLIAHLASLPVGASIMFWGALNWSELPSALKPLARFFQLLMLPLGIAFLQYVLISLRAFLPYGERPWMLLLHTLSDIPLVSMDVLLFALVWRICLLDKTTPREIEDPLEF